MGRVSHLDSILYLTTMLVCWLLYTLHTIEMHTHGVYFSNLFNNLSKIADIADADVGGERLLLMGSSDNDYNNDNNDDDLPLMTERIRKLEKTVELLIGKLDEIESNQIKSNQIKSNQIESNQIKSNQIKSN